MIKIIPDLKLRISNQRIMCMEMNIYEISRFIIENEYFISSIKEASEKEIKNALDINWKIATVKIEVVLSQYKRWNPWSKVISHYEFLDLTTFAIRYNPRKFPMMEDSQKIGNIIHESGHHFNYKHSFDWHRNRKYSGVYLIGYLYAYISEKMYEKPLIELSEMKEELFSGWKEHITKEIK